MGIKVNNRGKVILGALLAVGAFFGARYYQNMPKVAREATEVGKVSLPDAPEASLSGNASVKLPLPDKKVSNNTGTAITHNIMAWNAQFPVMYANGGKVTTKGSLFEKANLRVTLERQDDCNKTVSQMVKFANDVKNGNASEGFFASFMGDGMPAFFASLTQQLEPLGPEYAPIAFYTMGKSYGEDQFMGPVEWKRNPKAALGYGVIAVPRDGDANIVIKWAGDNGIKVNPSFETWDMSAINLISANDFLDVAVKWNAGYKETRKLIVNGKAAKDTIIEAAGATTWTPGDVNIAEGRGGLATIASTKQYSSQMPNVTFTIKKWANDHRTDIENWIMALGQAGDQVRSFNDAKAYAAEISAQVYAEKDAKYWLTYYNGVKKRDAQGIEVSLGGSMAFNLADAANFLGLGNDRIDRYKKVYTVFGDIMVKMYPEHIPSYPDYAKVVDKSFLSSVVSNHPELLEGKSLTVTYASEMSERMASKNYALQFETGKSTILSSSYGQLQEIIDNALIAETMKVGVYGHTDNTGSDETNRLLSEARANSVKNYLVTKGLPVERVESAGRGPSEPIADNASAEGRAKNRRVEIVLGE